MIIFFGEIKWRNAREKCAIRTGSIMHLKFTASRSLQGNAGSQEFVNYLTGDESLHVKESDCERREELCFINATGSANSLEKPTKSEKSVFVPFLKLKFKRGIKALQVSSSIKGTR